MTTNLQPYVSREDYLDREYTSETRHEFINGIVRPMPYTSKNHGRIITNLIGELSFCLKQSPYEIFANDRMIHIPICDRFYYPDLVVISQETTTFDYKQKMQADLHPIIIVEVLSDSTASIDRNEKWECYQKIPSLLQFVLISQQKISLEQYSRPKANAQAWRYSQIEDAEANLRIDECEITVRDIYRRVVLDSSVGD